MTTRYPVRPEYCFEEELEAREEEAYEKVIVWSAMKVIQKGLMPFDEVVETLELSDDLIERLKEKLKQEKSAQETP